ncbi:gamma-glutamyl-gamma-aminobutyrate hydrolase family protein [Aquabacterium sp. J223]|uniref:gamma-glutamyl-gamma-aminobutyrate hydrolase family protein n=1 Tax=Aquabacterium sp. J223 TaxID=2898431 RepID=UPI0021AE1132|nr:gamma-glutamyl-gamma-aminobutyrate hydrolase family protein [Aquabacterium sp. J223]UUX94305.1 gamma-glutamyl-gamma-aminobutyrate hydrolase family protein [Aquabacterium sp. J223]
MTPLPHDAPLILLPADHRTRRDGERQRLVLAPYVEAVRLAGGRPLMVPGALPEELDALLDIADGVLLTGSPSNVHPSHFGEAVLNEALPLDPERDRWTLPLIPRAIERGVPLFGICRGVQEMNVALGGSLHQAVHQVPGHADHRDRDADPIDVQYGPAHPIEVVGDGCFAGWFGPAGTRLTVNSLHGQGLNRLADALQVEARAPDGLVEAVSVGGASAFAVGVQWHPEWKAAENAVSRRLLTAYGEAARARRASRGR